MTSLTKLRHPPQSNYPGFEMGTVPSVNTQMVSCDCELCIYIMCTLCWRIYTRLKITCSSKSFEAYTQCTIEGDLIEYCKDLGGYKNSFH